MTELRRLWFSAYREYHWVGLVNPFEDVAHYYPRPVVTRRVAFRFPEYVLLKKYLSAFYHPIVDFLVLTGARPSEALGLKVHHITNEHIHFQESRVEKYHEEGEHGDMKDLACNRKMLITTEIQKRLDILLDRTDIEYFLVDEDGDAFSLNAFRNKIWNPAAKKAGINHNPQELRHTFTAWCQIAGIDKIRITKLMGHNNKDRVDDTYGFYVDGLEDDRDLIIEFFGDDFVKSDNVIEQPLLSKRGSKNPHRNR